MLSIIGLSRKPGSAGRLLSEFLVSLSLFFLILLADVMVLSKASDSAHQSAVMRRAVEIARLGMEEVIAGAQSGDVRPRQTREFPLDPNDEENKVTLTLRTAYTPLRDQKGLALAKVSVEWNNGVPLVKLERYVAGS